MLLKGLDSVSNRKIRHTIEPSVFNSESKERLLLSFSSKQYNIRNHGKLLEK